MEVALHPEGVDRNICCHFSSSVLPLVALHPEGVDRNCAASRSQLSGTRSPSTRRAWIEITAHRLPIFRFGVALHPEGVDRNTGDVYAAYMAQNVALHPEGVDRNVKTCQPCLDLFVALHPEGVDRNRLTLSATALQTQVALHPEGVDRNYTYSIAQKG